MIPDRIDIQVFIEPVPNDRLANNSEGETFIAIRARVIKPREIQNKRFADNPSVLSNAQMNLLLSAKNKLK